MYGLLLVNMQQYVEKVFGAKKWIEVKEGMKIKVIFIHQMGDMRNLFFSLFQEYNKKRGEDIADYTVGIFQSIGFKEFHNYLLLAEEEQNSVSGKDLFENGKELMMIATRQYARRQTKWIRQRFLRSDRYGTYM